MLLHHRLIPCLLAITAAGASCRACNVPVFRYALERWPADLYEVVVFHRGPLTDDQEAVVRRLDDASAEKPGQANFGVRLVDLDANPKQELLDLWERQGSAELPRVVALYPFRSGIQAPAWSGPLTPAAVDALIQSPMRADVARRLLKGAVAVWVLLECGDAKQDDAAAKLLHAQLEALKSSLELPALTEDDRQFTADPDAVSDLAVNFPMLRLPRDDPREQALAGMLLNSEDDLLTFKEPMAFPVFGRGRSLFALVGKGINEVNIGEACVFLVGPCSCQAKAMNPGTDLLMRVDWDRALWGEVDAMPVVPTALGLPAPAPSPAVAAAAQPVSTPERPARRALVRNALLVLVVGAMVVAVAAAWLLGRRRG